MMLILNSFTFFLALQAIYYAGAAPQQHPQQQQPASANQQLPQKPLQAGKSTTSNTLASQNDTPQPQQQQPTPQHNFDLTTTTTVDPFMYQMPTQMPLIDANYDLSDYSLDHMAQLNFANFAPNNADSKTSALIGRFHNEEQMYEYLKQLATAYPSVTRLYSIGESVEKRPLWVLEISEKPGEHQLLKPEFRYIANIHGNEIVGRELLLHLARLILENYSAPEKPDGVTSEEAMKPTGTKFIKKLVKNTRIHLMPSMNPDGYARSNVACKFEEPSRKGRLNANNIDLNRNFPDETLGTKIDAGTQPEVRAVIDWSLSEPFVLSANLHGGALVVSYPYDSSIDPTIEKDFSRQSPDHELYKTLALAYSKAHRTMYTGQICYDKCAENHPETFETGSGTTVGAAWYSLHGGMQDWMYNNTNDYHVTVELGCNQYPPAEALLQYWDFNRLPLLNYMRQVHRGIKGVIQDEQTNKYLANVIVQVEGVNHNVSSTRFGDYFRLLTAGSYVVNFIHPKYHPEKLRVQLREGMAQIYNIKMRPLDTSANLLNEIKSPGEETAAIVDEDGQQRLGSSNNDDHSIIVATLVMSILTILLLLSMVGAYLIQKQRYRRSQSVSVELQPRSSSTGVSLPKATPTPSSHHHQLSTSTLNTNIST